MFFFGFFLLLLVAYGGGHFGVYVWIVKFFSLENLQAKRVLASFLLFAGSSFFLASALAHFFNSPLTRFYYYISGLWMGVLVNLLLFFAAGLLASFLVKLLNISLRDTILGVVCIVAALLLSAYGTYTAKHFIVKKIQVQIPNLPAYWQGKKIVQLSDVHLGFVYRGDLIANIKQHLEKLQPDMVVITGDLLDGSDGDLAWVREGIQNIHAPEGVYFVTGNHETYLGINKAEGILEGTTIKELNDARVEKEGLQIVGISYPLRMENKDIKAAIESTGLDKSMPSILLYHSPVQIPKIKSTGISLQLSGHTHLGQLFPFDYITKMLYKGYDYGLKTEDGFSIYTTNGLGTWGPAMRTGNTPEMVEITLQ